MNTCSEPRVLLAFDTTDRINWGARGASTALAELLSTRFSNLDQVPGSFQTRRVPIGIKPAWLDRIAARAVNSRFKFWVLSAYKRIEHIFGAKLDFIDEDPAVSKENMLKYSERDYFFNLQKNVEKHDILVVDGNGDMIFKKYPSRYLLSDLALIELAHHLGKKVYYVNSIFSDCSLFGRNEALAARCIDILSKCEAVAFRDPYSVAVAQEMAPELAPAFVPDSLFYWYHEVNASATRFPLSGDFPLSSPRARGEQLGRFNFKDPYLCLSGGARAAWTPKEAAQQYSTLVERVKRLGLNVYLVPTCGGDHFMYEVGERTQTPVIPGEIPVLMGGAILARARLFISGRYHPSILAAFGGTPSVFLGADSHKILSLQQVLGYEEPKQFSAIPTDEECEEIYTQAKGLLERGEPLRRQIKETAERRASESERLLDLFGAQVVS